MAITILIMLMQCHLVCKKKYNINISIYTYTIFMIYYSGKMVYVCIFIIVSYKLIKISINSEKTMYNMYIAYTKKK